jgi:hypothetical protein
MPSIGALSDLLRQRRKAYDRGFEQEMAKLKRAYGRHAVAEAIAMAARGQAQEDTRSALSISALKKRRMARTQRRLGARPASAIRGAHASSAVHRQFGDSSS